MTSSICWIDRDGLARTLARLRSGGDPTMPLHYPARAQEPTAPAAAPIGAAFEPPPGSLRQRLDAFIDWLTPLAGGRRAFVVDRDGLPLVDRHTEADLQAMASSVIQLILRISSNQVPAAGQAAAVQLDEEQLVFLSVTTSIGLYIVGYVSHHFPTRESQQLIADGLRRAFEAAGDDRSEG